MAPCTPVLKVPAGDTLPIIGTHIWVQQYDLGHHTKKARDALREVLADSEMFLIKVPQPTNEEYYCCHHVSSSPSITISLADMLVKNPNHDRPLYNTGYIIFIKVERILIDPGLALSVMPVRLIQFLHIPIHKLSTITTTIHGFNAQSSRLV